MKKSFLSTCIICVSVFAFAQNNVGIGTAYPNNSALLDLTSTSKGLLIPRMSTDQRTAITTPAKGLMVFDNNTNGFWFYNGTVWNSLSTPGSLTLPLQQTINSGYTAIDITNVGTGGALKGESNSANGIGVYGESSNGAAVKGYGSNAGSVAVFGSALEGTGVKAFSLNGNALEVIGKVKISGGNTNPSSGAVLTSDATGNAVWKNLKVAFLAENDNGNQVNGTIGNEVNATLAFSAEEHDYNNNYSGGVFTAPVSGLYHFGAVISFSIYDINDNINFAYLNFQINQAGNTGRDLTVYGKNSTSSWANSSVSVDVKLSAGDKVSLKGWQRNTASINATWYGKFYGHLVFAD